MLKLFSMLFLASLGFYSASAQTPESGVSESTVYKPREFENQNLKKKKENNSKIRNADNRKDDDPAELKNDSVMRIPVFVYDAAGKPVRDLKAENFRLLIDNGEREILKLEAAADPLDILLIVDTSPSTAYDPKELKNFVTKLSQTLKPQDKIQIISFNGEIKVLCEPTSDPEVIKKAVKKLEMGDGTSIYDAVRTIFRKYAASGEKTVLLLSDGVDTTSQKADYASALATAEKSSAPVFPLYLYTFDSIPNYPPLRLPANLSGGRFPNPALVLRSGAQSGATKADYEKGLNFVGDLAALSGGRAFQIKSLADVKPDDLSPIVEVLAPHYFISFKPAASAGRETRRPLKVVVNRPNLKIQTRGSLIAP